MNAARSLRPHAAVVFIDAGCETRAKAFERVLLPYRPGKESRLPTAKRASRSLPKMAMASAASTLTLPATSFEIGQELTHSRPRDVG